jgi:hypothetical protein
MMEGMLLTGHNMTLSEEGIPYRLIYHLLESSREEGLCCHDANLSSGYGFGGDEDLTEINAMEKALGKLSSEQLDLRVVADFCCIWRYDYPESVHAICAAIGGSPNRAFRLHYQISPDRRLQLINYAFALKGWLEGKEPTDKRCFSGTSAEITRKVYTMLGPKDSLKELLVKRTYLGLSKRQLNCSYWGHNAKAPAVSLSPYTAQDLAKDWAEQMSKLEKLIAKEMGHKARDFFCEVGGAAEPACHFKFIRRIDILVSSIGCMHWRGNLPPKNGAVSGRRQITSKYLHVLEKYWKGRAGNSEGAKADPIAQELLKLLGPNNDFKRWLVASLWKNIKNQTMFQAYPMKRWIEFVRIGEDYLRNMASR